MCGAKLRPGATACHECGEPVPSMEEPISEVMASSSSTAVEAVPPGPDWTAAEELTDPDFEEPTRSRTGLWVGLVVGVGLLGAGGYAVATMSSQDEAPPPSVATEDADEAPAHDPAPPTPTPTQASCPELTALQGHWSFITEVTGTRVMQSSGLNGFYELDVALEDCAATATVTKTGYTARKFTDKRIQTATAPLTATESPRAGFFEAEFSMQSGAGPHGVLQFSFAPHGDALTGIYRQRGARWRDTGLSGFLHGVREGDYPRDPVAASQSCTTRCNLACDTATREGVTSDAMQACTSSCTEDPGAPARCGDDQPAPEAFALPLEGPGKLKSLCKGIGGCAKKLARGIKTPELATDRLPEGWADVKMVRGKKEGSPRLALHAADGWYLSAPLLDVPRKTKLGKQRLYGRQLGDGSARKYVLGLSRASGDDAAETFVVCRLDASASCVRVPKRREDVVTALPEGVLSVGARVDGPSGVFSW